MELFLLVCILVYKTNWKQVGLLLTLLKMLIEKGNNHATTYAIYAAAVASKQCSSSVLIISSNGRLLKYSHFLCILRL